MPVDTLRCTALLFALALGGCASTPPPAPPAEVAVPPAPPVEPPTPAQQRTDAAAKLAVERQWLASWFKGTPVVVGQRADGAVFVDVPREFCFEPGRDVVKPALAAVLDKVAQSLRRLPIAELHLIAAPATRAAAPRSGCSARTASTTTCARTASRRAGSPSRRARPAPRSSCESRRRRPPEAPNPPE